MVKKEKKMTEQRRRSYLEEGIELESKQAIQEGHEETDDEIVLCEPNKSQLVISHWYFFVVSCSALVIGYISCLLVAIFFHFENTTRTHCNVPNVLPSFSAAIGNNYPEVCPIST